MDCLKDDMENKEWGLFGERLKRKKFTLNPW